ncbi:MAG: nitroreductase family protein, partial [Erysipelotrichaceae bacterium]|nr:nitroreductase family protein [Erysipelotrichaceae bacterium]
MELNELLMKRRSVRKYEKTQISEKEIEELISSTLYAASW